MDGSGVFAWPDGRKYTGQYKDDLKEGEGRFEWPDGKIYVGNWRHGKMDGKGIMIKDNVQTYGIWKKGERVRKMS